MRGEWIFARLLFFEQGDTMPVVDLVTIHHEGGGSPSDNVGRFSEGGYCYGIGVTLWERWRSPNDNWATMNYNGEDLTICLSGNRMDAPVTDDDIKLIHEAYMDCHKRGEVTDSPLVRAHRNSPGSATACPGDKTIDVWSKVEEACRPGSPPPPDKPAGGKEDMVVIGLKKTSQPNNQQPFGFLDPVARKVWSHWGFRITWDGGGVSTLHGDSPPQYMNIPGSAPLVNWQELDTNPDGTAFDTLSGTRKRICAYGINGAEYTGTAHG
jgi:hypothetical protein